MELIAATRVVKAQQRARAARPYAEQITAVIENLAAGGAEVDHPLLRRAEKVERVGVIVISSDRGLAGPYNSSVIKAAERQVQNARSEGADYSLIVIGKKARDYFGFRKYAIESFTMGISDNPTYEDARRIADEVSAMFSEGRIDRVELAYTEFISLGSQKVATRRFLPLESTEVMAEEGHGEAGAVASFEFEPSPEAVLEALLPPIRGGPPLWGTARVGCVRARQQAAGDEGRNRQRRGDDRQVVPRDEPGTPGRHHHRDHGDCRRCRGPWQRRRHDRHTGARGQPGLTDQIASEPKREPGVTMTVTEAPAAVEPKDGHIVGIAGPVIDAEFPPAELPEINTALEFDVVVDGESVTIVAEVAQQIGGGRVRAIAMKPTDGLTRGTVVRNTGRGITVPVGDVTLGHVFNVIGDQLDNEPLRGDHRPLADPP